MTKERTNRDIQKVNTPEGLPDYLASLAKEDNSLQDLKQERTLSRIKVIQGQSNQELKKLFNEGDVIVSPGQTLIANVIKTEGSSQPFFMVPLIFFVEYCKWSDMNDNGSPTILARSYDKGSDIAVKAKSFEQREEKYGDGNSFTARYVEHLNFACVLVGDHALAGQMEPFILGFCRGEWTMGKNFITTIARMNAPLWSTVWKFNSSARQKKSFNWWGIDYSIPNPEQDGINRFITQDQVELFKASHEELRKLHEEHRLVVDHSDNDEISDTNEHSDF